MFLIYEIQQIANDKNDIVLKEHVLGMLETNYLSNMQIGKNKSLREYYADMTNQIQAKANWLIFMEADH